MSTVSPIFEIFPERAPSEDIRAATTQLWAGDNATGVLVIPSFVNPESQTARKLRIGISVSSGFVSIAQNPSVGLQILGAIGALRDQARSDPAMGLPDPWTVRTETDINGKDEDSIPTLHFYALLRGANMAIQLTDSERQVNASANGLAIVRGNHRLSVTGDSDSKAPPVLISSAYPGTQQVEVVSSLPPAQPTSKPVFVEHYVRRPSQKNGYTTR